jgi:class 3 adenylate cyclase
MPETKYTRSGELHIAYQTVGEGDVDLVYIPGWVSHVEEIWQLPRYARFLDRLTSFSRLIVYDKRGTGASDRLVSRLSLDEQMDDLRAVLDATGTERAALFGAQDGASIGIVFAATHPERTRALITFGTRARFLEAPDYPWGLPTAMIEPMLENMEHAWADREANVSFATYINPGLRNDEETLDFMMHLARVSASPDASRRQMEMYTGIDLRAVLPTIGTPTLVIARSNDSFYGPDHARFIAEHTPGARYVELPGTDAFIPAGDLDAIADEIEEFVTGQRPQREPDRVLATILFTDLVASTQRSAEMGDRAWRDLLDRHDAIARRQLDRFRGRWVRHTGDGFLATFDRPAGAIRCAVETRDMTTTLGIETRSGLHAGEVLLRGDDLAGLAMSIGARVMEQAGDGEILVSQSVKDLVAGAGIEFADRGVRSLKGVPGEWHLFKVA